MKGTNLFGSPRILLQKHATPATWNKWGAPRTGWRVDSVPRRQSSFYVTGFARRRWRSWKERELVRPPSPRVVQNELEFEIPDFGATVLLKTLPATGHVMALAYLMNNGSNRDGIQ